MSEDIKVTDGTVLESLNNKVDLDGGNYKGSLLEEYIHQHCGGGSGFSLFDTKISDHILEGEEVTGWALQGTYVNASVYPDFYNTCFEQKEAATANEVTLGDSTLTMYVNDNGHQFYNIADKSIVDTFYEVYGIADFYGIDEENERIFLPRNKYFHQLTDDIQKVNEMIEAGLPNIIGGMGQGNSLNTYGAFYIGGGTGFGFNANYGSTTYFDASRCSEIYGKSDTVQPPSSLKLLYYCVGNTDVTRAITNVTEVTTSENDTIPLFTGMYFDFKPNNVSWLKAGEQQNGGGVYKTCYDQLVEIVNGVNNFDLKVINQADIVSGVVYDEYWILDQDNLTFRTPLTIATKSLSGGVVGNGNNLGLTVGGADVMLRGVTTEYTRLTTSTSSNTGTVGVAQLSNDEAKSGIIAQQSSAQLYFKVANAVQNLELLDVGRVMEEAVLRSSLVEAQVVVETYQNGTSWYRVWSDGWCEQGGYANLNSGSAIELLKPFNSTDYNISLTCYANGNVYFGFNTKTVSNFKLYTSYNPTMFDWQARGYIK